MKRIIIIMLAGILVGLFLYYMNQAALEPTDGLTLDGKKVVNTNGPSSAPSSTKFEPLDLSSKENFSIISKAHAENASANFPRIVPRTMGNPNANVKMYVLSSLTCTHCSAFHTTALKEIEAKYVHTGKVFMTYVDFPFDRRALAGAMLARCVNPKDYFTFLEVLFKNQDKWAFKPDAEQIVTTYVSLQGLSKGDVRACLADQTLQNYIVSTRDSYIKKYDVSATPTTIIQKGKDVEIVVGADLKELNKVLKKMTD